MIAATSCRNISQPKKEQQILSPSAILGHAKKAIIISVDSVGKIFIGSKYVPADSLKNKLQQESAKFKEKPVVDINADSTTAFKNVMFIIQDARDLGLEFRLLVPADRR